MLVKTIESSENRPKRFEGIVGSGSVLNRIKTAIAKNRLERSIFITGPTGAGKTTLARVLARRVLCENTQVGEVEGCGNCKACTIEVLNNHYYYEEVGGDYAYLEDRMNLWQTHDPHRLYFIDEVQDTPPKLMKRLKKIVEDSQATFILATTHFEKIEDALYNRFKTSHYELLRPSLAEVVLFLANQANHSGVKYANDGQLERVAEGYNREMRPIAKFIDKVLAETENETITDEYLDELFGPVKAATPSATQRPRRAI